MQITSVKLRKIEKEGSRMKGIVSIILDDSIAIHDIRVIQGEERLFVAMPSKKRNDGEYQDIVHPINHEFRNLVETAILEEYNKQ